MHALACTLLFGSCLVGCLAEARAGAQSHAHTNVDVVASLRRCRRRRRRRSLSLVAVEFIEFERAVVCVCVCEWLLRVLAQQCSHNCTNATSVVVRALHASAVCTALAGNGRRAHKSLLPPLLLLLLT